MRQVVQLEGSSWCGPIAACMVMDHFGVTYDVEHAKRRIAEYRKVSLKDFAGCYDNDVASYLTEQGLAVLLVDLGFPLQWDEDHKYFYTTHKNRENRVITWYRVHDMLRMGYVAIVAIERDAGKHHFVCVDDAFMRAQERWFSVCDPIRGAYEEQAERFLLTVDGKGHALKWIFVKRSGTRFASAADFSTSSETSDD